MAGFMDIIQKLMEGAQGGGQADPTGGANPMPGNIGALLSGASGAQGDGSGNPAPAQPVAAPQMQAPAAPAPVTPPETDAGLGGFLSRMVHKATDRNPDTGMSFMDRLGQVGAGMTDQMGDSTGAQAALQKQAAQRVSSTQDDAKRQKMNALAAQLGMSPREQLIFLADPDAWVKANGPRLGIHDTAEGAQTHYGDPGSADSKTITAPKFGQENGEGYAVTPEKVTDLGGLAPSPAQKIAEAVKEAQEKALDAYHQHMAAAAQQNADTNRQRANKPALGNGGDWRSRVVGQGSVP